MAEHSYAGNPEEDLLVVEAPDTVESLVEASLEAEEDAYQLKRIYRQISFLTKAYREVMSAFYLDGLSVKDIAAIQGVKETTIKQRLFSARNLIRQEEAKGTGKVTMERKENKPVAFQKN